MLPNMVYASSESANTQYVEAQGWKPPKPPSPHDIHCAVDCGIALGICAGAENPVLCLIGIKESGCIDCL